MVTFRWQVASGGGRHPFSAEALEALGELSEGLFTLSLQALLDSFILGLVHVAERTQTGRNQADRAESLPRLEG